MIAHAKNPLPFYVRGVILEWQEFSCAHWSILGTSCDEIMYEPLESSTTSDELCASDMQHRPPLAALRRRSGSTNGSAIMMRLLIAASRLFWACEHQEKSTALQLWSRHPLFVKQARDLCADQVGAKRIL
eukprot:5708724-Amphidinium_carterae.1